MFDCFFRRNRKRTSSKVAAATAVDVEIFGSSDSVSGDQTSSTFKIQDSSLTEVSTIVEMNDSFTRSNQQRQQQQEIDAYGAFFGVGPVVGKREQSLVGFTDSDSECSTCSSMTPIEHEHLTKMVMSPNSNVNFGRIQYNQNGNYVENLWNHKNKNLSHVEEEEEEDSDNDIDERPILQSYHVIDGLGVGGFATVVKVEESVTKQIYAMKVIPLSKKMKKNLINQQNNELQVLLSLTPSPFLQQCFDAFKSNKHLFFIFEYYDGGDLFYHLKKKTNYNLLPPNQLNNEHQRKGAFSETEEGLIILAEIFLGLEHMHVHHFIHADLKIENIMVNKDGHIKIVDFGLATPIISNIQPMRRHGSLTYMAPELLISKTGGRHTDWWAYGILAYELLTGCFPWKHSNSHRDLLVNEIATPHDIEIPEYLFIQTKTFIHQLLNYDFINRLGFHHNHDIKKNIFFNNINWEQLEKLNYPSPFSFDQINNNKGFSPFLKKNAIDKYDNLMS